MGKKDSVVVCSNNGPISYDENLVGLNLVEALRKFGLPNDHVIIRLNGNDADIHSDEVLKPGDRLVFTMRSLCEFKRVVVWKFRDRPSQKTLRRVLEEYVGQGSRVSFNADKKCFLCSLQGNSSSYPCKNFRGEIKKENRQFSVYWQKDGIEIRAHRPDFFTKAVVDGFAMLCNMFWD